MVSTVGCCCRIRPCLPVLNWEVRQEELVSRTGAAGQNGKPLRVGCRFWSSFALLLEPLQTCPGTALGQMYQPCEGQHGRYSSISPACLGMKRRLQEPALSSMGSTRKRVVCYGERKPNLFCSRQVYFTSSDLCELAGVSSSRTQTCYSPSVSPCFLLPAPALVFPSPFSYSFFYHDKQTRHIGPYSKDLKSVHIPVTRFGTSGSLEPANWECQAQEHLLGHVAMAQNAFKALAPFLTQPGCCGLCSARCSAYGLNSLHPVFTE